jgi:hypothetical protein
LICQRYFNKYTSGYELERISSSSGESATISYLHEERSDLEKMVAVLICSSLFYRIESSRGHYPKSWPSYQTAEFLNGLAAKKWLDDPKASTYNYWNSLCTTVLPYKSHDYDYKIESMNSLIRYIAEEHALLFLNYQMVEIQFSEKRDPLIEQTLNLQRQAEADRSAQWKIECEERNRIEKERLDAIKLKHPRYDEWDGLSSSEIEVLVWSKATSKLALEFGVSDVFIGKKCKALGIEKPPKGFWARVAAGLTPHPNGKNTLKNKR